MTCQDAIDFVSALCDGQRIPREAAEHIGQCGECRTRLQDYAILGAELRRTASLHLPANAPAFEVLLSGAEKGVMQRAKEGSRFFGWWRKGAEAMRIPRFAFATLILVIVGLSSGLVVVKARSTAQGPVLLVTMRVPKLASPWQCALSTTSDPSRNWCSGLMPLKEDGGWLQFGAHVQARQEDQIIVGIRSQFYPPSRSGPTVSFADFETLPVEQYKLEPGQTLHIKISGLGEAELTGELLDHMPAFPLSPGESLDPAPNEMRLISPLLLRGRQAIIDSNGNIVSGTAKDGAVWMYEPRVGRLIVSAQNFQGAVKGKNKESRIDFEINGSQYRLLSGAPITRAQDVYVRLDPDYQPPSQPAGVIGWATLRYLLGEGGSPD